MPLVVVGVVGGAGGAVAGFEVGEIALDVTGGAAAARSIEADVCGHGGRELGNGRMVRLGMDGKFGNEVRGFSGGGNRWGMSWQPCAVYY